jgi:hypothetical protein
VVEHDPPEAVVLGHDPSTGLAEARELAEHKLSIPQEQFGA